MLNAARIRFQSGLLFAIAFVCVGCISPKSYVDPKLPKVSYESISPRATPATLVLKANFQRNGENKPKLDSLVQNKAALVLRASRQFSTVQSEPAAGADTLLLTVNNVADMAAAVGKGFGTGLTFGLAGSLVTDGYEIKAVYMPNGGKEITKTYTHAIHTTIGNKKGPEGLQSMTPTEAFDRVVEEVVLKFVSDLKTDGVL